MFVDARVVGCNNVEIGKTAHLQCLRPVVLAYSLPAKAWSEGQQQYGVQSRSLGEP